MYFVFPVIVTVIVIVLLQCLSCSFGQNQKVNIADMHYDYDYDYDNDKEQDTNSVLQSPPPSSPWWRSRRRCKKSDEGKPKRKFFFLLRRCHVHAFFMTKMTLAQESRVSSLARAPSRHIPCGPSMMLLSGNLWKPPETGRGGFCQAPVFVLLIKKNLKKKNYK